MQIVEAEERFLAYLAKHGETTEGLLPERLLELGFKFYEEVRAIDALPATDDDFGDSLLFQWGVRRAYPPYYGDCYYIDLTRQFIAQAGEDDDAIFQLSCKIEYELTAELHALKSDNRWCASFEDLPAFKAFAFGHEALAAVAGRRPTVVSVFFTAT